VTIPVATALARRDRFWPAATLSVAVHAAVIAWALVEAPPPLDLDRKPLHARLVRLGEVKPESFLPRKAEEAPPAEPPPAEAPPAVAEAPAPAPSPAPAVKAPPPRKGKAPADARAGSSALGAAMSKVQREVIAEQRWGDPSGDPGGDSEESEGDRYQALVERALRQNYDVPSTISDAERLYLSATVLVYVERDGRITRWRFERRSGNPAFDAALERTLRAAHLPPPPDAQRDAYRRTGLQVTFKI
jgi:colicin import membrane protein/protein TonB